MKIVQLSIAVAGLAALLAGCASKGGARSEPPASAAATADTSGAWAARPNGPPHMHGRVGMGESVCPMGVQGTTMSKEDVDGGAALVFTTKSGDVGDLRNRVRSLAESHNGRRSAGGPGLGRGVGMGTCPAMPPSTASVEDVDGGARLVLKATDPSRADALRQNLETCSQRVARGECPVMMLMQPQEDAQPKPPPGG